MAAADRVRVAREYYGNRRGRSLGRLSVDGTRCNDNIDLEPDQFLRQAGEQIKPPLGPAVFNNDVPALNPTQIAQPLAETFEGMRPHGRTVPQETDAVDLLRLLRPGSEGRGKEAAGHGRKECSTRDH